MQRSFSCIRSISKNPTVFKRNFAWISEPRFDDQFGWLISISSRKAINVSEFRGQPAVSIREYTKLDDGRTSPTKKGIFMTEDNYKALMQCEKEIKTLIEKTKKGETE
ncbi:hypothetical protein WA577_006879 [Blastocystis sp. JDR]